VYKKLGIIAIMAIIGLFAISCDDGNSTIDPCANGHTFPLWTNPTCTVAGNSERICTKCTQKETRTTDFAALGHQGLTLGVEATCTVAGTSESGTCTRADCGEDITETIIPALGHKGNWSITTSPNFATEADGEETRICTVCSTSEKRIYKFYKIGDTGPAGGIVYYAAQTSFTLFNHLPANNKQVHYLEAWTHDEVASAWGDYMTQIENITTFEYTGSYMPTGEYTGYGLRDTQRIVAHMNGKGITNTAAQRASSTKGGYSDWFLPSIDELNELYEFYKSKEPGYGNLTTSLYLSSSQDGSGSAWVLNFDNGSFPIVGKHNNFDVRAVRAF